MFSLNIKLKYFIIIALFLFTFLITIDLCLAWKLRDLTKSDENKNAVPSKKIFRDLPMKRKITISEELKHSDGDDEDDANDDDNEENTKKFKFEKVRQTHFDLPAKPLPKVSHPDVELEEQEEIEQNIDEQILSELLEPIVDITTNILIEDGQSIGKIGDKKVNDNVVNEAAVSEVKHKGFFEWLKSFRTKEDEIVKQNVDSSDSSSNTNDENNLDTINWLSYLDRKPFNLILKYIKNFKIINNNSNNNKENVPIINDVDEKSDQLMKMNKEEQDAAGHRSNNNNITFNTFERLLLTIPSFVPDYSKIADLECKLMGEIFQRQIRGQKMWTLQMIDSSGKIASGLLRGNANQLGDYDMCTEIRTKIKIQNDKNVKIKGKYCLANIDIYSMTNESKLPVHLLQGRNLLRSKLDDPSHFLPRFSTIKWALCVPHGCSHENVQTMLNDFLASYNYSTGLTFLTEIKETDCSVKRKIDWIELIKSNWQMSATIGYFTFFLVATVIASLSDYWTELKLDKLFANDSSLTNRDEQSSITEDDIKGKEIVDELLIDGLYQPEGILNQMLMSFSLKRTIRQLFKFDSIDDNDAQIYCIYGLKGFSIILLFISFKFLTIGHMAFSNRSSMTEILNSPLSIILRNNFLYMETFLLISGFLATHKMTEDIQKYNEILWFRRLIGRFLRLTPSIFAVLIFTAWIWEHLTVGPQWGNLIKSNADLCKENLWKNMLFIQNWYPIESQCAPHLLQLSIDTQFYFILPIILWLLKDHTMFGIGIFGIIHAFSTAIRYSDTIYERLSTIAFHGMKLSQLYRTINLSYGSIIQRATSYFIGVGLAIMLQQSGRQLQMPKAIMFFGWMTTIWSIIWCFWTPYHLTHKDYVYDPMEIAHYTAWSPLVWSLALSWIIFVCFTSSRGFIINILCSKPLRFLSRLSFQIHLIQFLILFYFAGTTRNLESFNLPNCINAIEIFIIIIIAILLTLIFDLPMQSINKIITNITIVSADDDYNNLDTIDDDDDDQSKNKHLMNKSESFNRESNESPSENIDENNDENNINENIWNKTDDDEQQNHNHINDDQYESFHNDYEYIEKEHLEQHNDEDIVELLAEEEEEEEFRARGEEETGLNDDYEGEENDEEEEEEENGEEEEESEEDGDDPLNGRLKVPNFILKNLL